MTFDITPIVEAVAAVLCAVVTCVLVPYIKSKTTTEQQKEINAWVKIAVAAAEQIYTGSGRGEEKKAYVLEWLRAHGVTVDDEKLAAMIEAAVYELAVRYSFLPVRRRPATMLSAMMAVSAYA